MEDNTQAEGDGDAGVRGLVVHTEHPEAETVESNVRDDALADDMAKLKGLFMQGGCGL